MTPSEFQSQIDAARVERRSHWPKTDLTALSFISRTRTITENGIELPYVVQDYFTGDVTDTGMVFVTEDTLEELSEQDRWDSQRGKVLLLGRWEGLALEQAGLAERETKGGYHRSDIFLSWHQSRY